MADRYDTPLTPQEEAAYQRWLQSLPDYQRSTEDYDLRGAWKAGYGRGANGHFPDDFKKPNHPTFSNESRYSTPQMQGGQWTGEDGSPWVFWASQQNARNMPMNALASYFSEVEPGNTVVYPSDFRLQSGGVRGAYNALNPFADVKPRKGIFGGPK